MAVTPAAFKTRFPEFVEVSDLRVQQFLNEAQLCVNNVLWGNRADTGIGYMAAHLLTTFDSDKGKSGQGALTQKRVGALSASFGFGDHARKGSHSSTKYGIHFDSLGRKVIGTPRAL